MRFLISSTLLLVSSVSSAQDNHLGVTLPGLSGKPERRIQIAKELGATWYRPAPVLLNADAKCEDCETARSAGLSLSLVVRNANSASKPSAPISDPADFKRKLRDILNREKPGILVVEDEPDDPKSFTGTSDDYRAELAAACEVSSELKIPCANGGFSSHNIALLAIDQRYSSDPNDAANIANTTEIVRVGGHGTDFNILGTPVANVGENRKPVIDATRKFLDKNQHEIDRMRQFIDAVNQSKVDRLNFHWYELQVDNLPKVLDSLHEVSKLPLMSDGMGDKSGRAFAVGEQIKTSFDNYVWPMIWQGTDDREIQGLVDKNGKLRPTANAFKSEAARQ
ncbi:MAG TPA: glycosyl hydrolase [Terriglobales bacterium]